MKCQLWPSFRLNDLHVFSMVPQHIQFQKGFVTVMTTVSRNIWQWPASPDSANICVPWIWSDLVVLIAFSPLGTGSGKEGNGPCRLAADYGVDSTLNLEKGKIHPGHCQDSITVISWTCRHSSLLPSLVTVLGPFEACTGTPLNTSNLPSCRIIRCNARNHGDTLIGGVVRYCHWHESSLLEAKLVTHNWPSLTPFPNTFKDRRHQRCS